MSLPPKRKDVKTAVDCKNRAVVPVTDSTVKRNHKISNADDYVWGQEEPKKYGCI
jgi:hypothetical protein